MKTFAISIPKPCHEDWNKMTPDAKGAFCESCQKSVYDFSNKTDEEIISVFEKEEKGKVCGRFTPAQLSRPVVTFGNSNSTNRLAVFLYALLLSFGATLFSGAEVFGQEVKGEMKVKVMGKMAMHPIITETVSENDAAIKVTKVVTVKPSVCGTKIIMNTEVMSLGQAFVIEKSIIEEPIEEPIIVRMGDTIYEEISESKIIETIPVIEKISVLTVIETPPIIEEQIMISGDIDFQEIPVTMAIITTPTNDENITTIGIDTLAIEMIKGEVAYIPEPIALIEPEMMVAGGVSYVEIIEIPQEEISPTDAIIEDKPISCNLIITPVEDKTEDKPEVVAETIIIPETEESPEVKSTLVETIIHSELEVKVSPNPSNGQITLSYNLETIMPVRIDLFDITGKFVKTLTQQGNQYPGKYNVSYNLADLQSGIYFATLLTNDKKSSAKIILTK